MRPSDYSDQEIIEAGNKLLADGVPMDEITGSKLRTVVGGGQVKRLLRVWLEYLKAREELPPVQLQALPPEVEAQLAVIGAEVQAKVAALLAEAHSTLCQRFAEKEEELEAHWKATEARAEREVAEASDTIDRLDQEIDGLNATVDRQRGEIEELRLQLSEVSLADREKAVRVENLVETLDQRNRAIEKAQLQEIELRSELSETKNQLTVAVQRQGDLHTQVLEMRRGLEEARAGEQAARDSQASVSGQLATLQQVHGEDAETIQLLQAEVRKLEGSLAALQAYRTSAEAVLIENELQVPGYPSTSSGGDEGGSPSSPSRTPKPKPAGGRDRK